MESSNILDIARYAPLITEMNLLVERCSKFSGWQLVWELINDGKVLIIYDPKSPIASRLSVSLTGGLLHENLGRLRDWAITDREEGTLVDVLTAVRT